jgi:hypothetical protein
MKTNSSLPYRADGRVSGAVTECRMVQHKKYQILTAKKLKIGVLVLVVVEY